MRSRSAVLELTFLCVLVMVALFGLFTWLCLKWERSWLLEEVRHGLSLTSDTLHSSLRSSMMQNQRSEILGTIERVARDTRIKRIRIIGHGGKISLSTFENDLNRRVEKNAPGCSICHTESGKAVLPSTFSPESRTVLEENTMRTFTPVLAEPGCVTQTCHELEGRSRVLGVIDLSLSLEKMEETLRRRQLKLSAFSFAIIILGGSLLWLALARRLRRPMRDVLRGIRRVANGDLNHRIPAHAQDEFGELAQSFNSMSRQLHTIQQGLIQSERLISMGKLAAGVAHEINNPLTGILSYSEDLLEDAAQSDPCRKDYEVIVTEALRCRQIVRSLLDFARQDAPSMINVHIPDLMEKALDVVVRQAAFRNIRFERNIEKEIPGIEADPIQIQQVLVNLIINAQQAMPNGGVITLGARGIDNGKQVELSVKDQGPGIPAEIRSKIFEPFFSTKGGETNGLGLAVCLGIVQQHGGTIDFEIPPAGGTSFRVILPIAKSGERHVKEGTANG